jgi:hypothetical protein
MSPPHDRTVLQLVREIEHITGVVIKIRWQPLYGLYLQDAETGAVSVLGWGYHRWSLLSPAVQENVCRELNRQHVIVQLLLNDTE